MSTNNWVKIAIVLIAFIAVGILRDFIFVNWNYQLDTTEHHRSFTYAHSFFDFISDWTYTKLYWSKWVLTAVFCSLNFFIGYLFFSNQLQKKQLLYLYLTVGVVAILIFSTSYFNFKKGYLLSREIIGFLQSPLPTVILYFTSVVFPKKV